MGFAIPRHAYIFEAWSTEYCYQRSTVLNSLLSRPIVISLFLTSPPVFHLPMHCQSRTKRTQVNIPIIPITHNETH